MERERKQNGLVVALLLVTVLSLSVAFAATLSSTLTVNGQATVGNAKWDVHFKTASTADDSELTATTGPTITGATNNVVEYTVALQEGKTYKLDLEVENLGTYNAVLNELKLTGAEGYDFITYKVADDSEVKQGDTLNADGDAGIITLVVTMGTITNDNVGQLENGLTLTLTATAKFVPAD